jgi:hypothetical protein
VGVEEVKGGRSRVLGVQTHLNDSDLQQFVNSKTQRPVEFSYTAFPYQGQQVGIIHIPVQHRPLFLTRDFGRLRRGVVYVRRGSSTAEADPDEIARMGAAAPLASEVPQLKLELAAPDERSLLGETATLKPIVYTLPPAEEIPDYPSRTAPLWMGIGANRDLYRELAVYTRERYRVEPIRFAVTNVGTTTANDVRLEAHLSRSDLYVLDEYDRPNEPVRNRMIDPHLLALNIPLNCDVNVERLPEGWRIAADFGKCQPNQTIFSSSSLYLGARSSCEFALRCQLFADELPHPIESSLRVCIAVEEQELSLDRLLTL